MKPHRLTMASAVIAGLASLGYTLAYIGRWEWQRAQLAADLTLLCAVFVLGLVIDSRTRDLRGRRTGEPPTGPRQPEPADPAAPYPTPPRHLTPHTGARVTPLRPATTARPRPKVSPGAFAWLDGPTDPRTERYGVFIPILLGAGMVASGMAWVLERVSGKLTRRPAPGRARTRDTDRATDRGGTRDRSRTDTSARLRPTLPDTLLLPADTRLADVLVGYDTADPAELWLRGPLVTARPHTAAPAPRDREGEKQP